MRPLPIALARTLIGSGNLPAVPGARMSAKLLTVHNDPELAAMVARHKLEQAEQVRIGAREARERGDLAKLLVPPPIQPAAAPAADDFAADDVPFDALVPPRAPRLAPPRPNGAPIELPPLPVAAADAPASARPIKREPPTPPIDWSQLIGEPPPRTWWMQDWLTPAATTVNGAGGIGKTLVMQAITTALATGCEYLTAATSPLVCLNWFCEDDRDEIWRRQRAMNSHFGLEPADLHRLHTVARLGHENTLLDVVFGKPAFTPLMELLREQVNDLKADVLVLDNVAQIYGGIGGDNHQVTMFVNGIRGLVTDRPFAPILLGHVARAQGSEYAGPAAWENACRMRWYLGPTLPDQKPDEDEEADPDTIYLAKRKANYSAKDYLKLRYAGGLFVPDTVEGRRFDAGQRNDLAERVVLKGLRKLREAGVLATDGPTSPDYLPRQIAAKGFSEGHTKRELAAAMNRLMGSSRLKRDVVGTYSNRTQRMGLVEVAF